jgi:hypothetical protein
MGADAGRLAPQPRHRFAVDEIVTRGHFRYDQPGAEGRGQTPKGRIRNARHRRQKNPARDLNITYFQGVIV